MLSLAPLQRAIMSLYGLDVLERVDQFVHPMRADDPECVRRETLLVREVDGPPREAHLELRFDPAVGDVLEGAARPGLSRFDAWCLAVEGVSHFVLIAHRATQDRPVSLLELEIQADVDKFALALIDRSAHAPPHAALASSSRLRQALFDRARFHDGEHTERGIRYRRAHRCAARYTRAIERRFVRNGRLDDLVRELRAYYRAPLDRKLAGGW